MAVQYDTCKCGATKRRTSATCKACHNREIAPKGYAAMVARWGEKWAVNHLRDWRLEHPSDLEQLVRAALDTLGVKYEREFKLTARGGRKAHSYLIDFMVRRPSDWTQVAIEINGVWAHQFHSKRDRRKMSLLKRRGYPVIVLSDEDIKAKRASERESKAAELVAKLRELLGMVDQPDQPGQIDSEPVPGFEWDIPF